MKKFFSFVAAALLSVCAFADRNVVPTTADVEAMDPTTNIVFCIYFDGTVCNDIVAIGTFNGWNQSDGLLKLRAVNGFEGWYAVAIPYAAGTKGKICQLLGDGSFTWGTQATNWTPAGTNLTLEAPDGDGNCVFGSAGLYTYYAEFSSDACDAKKIVIKVYAPECEWVEPTIAGDFNNWGNDDDADTDMDMDIDEDGNIYYYKEIENGVGKYKIRGGYGYSNPIEGWIEEEDTWINMFPEDVPLRDSTYYFNDPELFRYQTCEEPVECDSVEYTITVTFPACEGTTPAIIGDFPASGWEPVAMTATATPNVYTATVKALCTNKYKFCDAVTKFENEPIDAEGKTISDIKFGEEAEITLDFSDYTWKACAEPQAIGHVFENARIEKVIENGQLIIKVDGVRYTTTGARL